MIKDVLACIGAIATAASITVVVWGLRAARNNREAASQAHEASARLPVYELPVVHGDGGSISDVVEHFEHLH